MAFPFFRQREPTSEGIRSKIQQMNPNGTDNVSVDGTSMRVSPDESTGPSPFNRRTHVKTRDIRRTYSGMYGDGDDLLPFEVSRIEALPSVGMFFFTYVTLLALGFLVVLLVLQVTVGRPVVLGAAVMTLINLIHLCITSVHVHWLKGNMIDPHGEMNAMTVWEQLEARGSEAYSIRQILLLIPVLICWIACYVSGYENMPVLANVLMLVVTLLPKLPVMNGVRILKISKVVGIDDFVDETRSDDQSKGD